MDPLNPITYFAETDARNKKIKFGIKAKDRLKHMYIIGKTGMGKSTLLENLAIQDIQNGEGLAFIDPHGGTAEKLLEYVPEHRVKDVLYFAPFDMEYPIAFNVMEDVAPDKRHLVVNGLMATFEKIWADAWSARMAYILQYAIIALLEYPDSSLLGINKMLSDKEYRKKVVDNITDASAKSFWVDEFGKYTERFAAEATPAIQNKVGQFTSNALVRNIIGQPKSSFDIRKMMDEKKILIINLSKGQVGELNARLLGSMLITKIYLAAMSRADMKADELQTLPNFYLYVDEFQSFANKSFADILSEARKYKLNLTIAHQYIEQMEEEVRDAVFGNVGTMISFRVGAFDAEVLEKEFAPVFTAEDLVNLGFTQVYLKLMIDGVSSAPFSATTLNTPPRPEVIFKDQVIASSQKIYGRVRKEVEESVTRFYEGNKMPVSPQKPSNEIRDTRYDGDRHQEQRPHIPELRSPLTPDREISTPQRRSTDPINQLQTQPRQETDQNKIVFVKAKEELEKKNTGVSSLQSRNLNGNEKQNIFSPTQTSSFKPQASKISLTDLRPKHEKAKIPTKENVNSLKDALAQVMGGKSQVNSQQSIVKTETKVVSSQQIVDSSKNVDREKEKKSSPSPAKDYNLSSNNSPHEVPEDVLRQLLDLEAPKVSQ